MVAGLPPNYYQWPTGGPLVVMRRLGTEAASRHYPAGHMRLEADPVPLGLAEWQLVVSYWPLKPVKWNISRHRGGQEDKRVGSVAACCWQYTSGPPCNPPLCHPVGEGQLAVQWWLASGGLPAGHWCYVCRVYYGICTAISSCKIKIICQSTNLHWLSDCQPNISSIICTLCCPLY